jgi:phosphatidylserine/phosphatidylglycerophosphate/cardiolipin synthase-like enzyme
MRRIASFIRKTVIWSTVVFVACVVCVYLAFLAIMTITESSLLEDAPFHASIDYRSHKPHELTLIDEGEKSLASNDSIPNRSDRWGVHAKRGVIDESTILIGTYNIDPRSANLNSELMVICRGNRDLAMEMKNSILARIDQSKIVLDGTKDPDADALIGDAPWKSIAMMFIAMPVSKVFDFLL